jgi:hypothetical protein
MNKTKTGPSWAQRRSTGRAHLLRLIAEGHYGLSVYEIWRPLLVDLGYYRDPALRRSIVNRGWRKASAAWGVIDFAKLPYEQPRN